MLGVVDGVEIDAEPECAAVRGRDLLLVYGADELSLRLR